MYCLLLSHLLILFDAQAILILSVIMSMINQSFRMPLLGPSFLSCNKLSSVTFSYFRARLENDLSLILWSASKVLNLRVKSDGVTGKASPSTQSAQPSPGPLRFWSLEQKLWQTLVWRFSGIHNISCLVAFRNARTFGKIFQTHPSMFYLSLVMG